MRRHKSCNQSLYILNGHAGSERQWMEVCILVPLSAYYAYCRPHPAISTQSTAQAQVEQGLEGLCRGGGECGCPTRRYELGHCLKKMCVSR